VPAELLTQQLTEPLENCGMSEVFSVIYTGKLASSADQARLVNLFSEKFKLGQEKARKLIIGGRPVTLKKDLDREKALKYREALEKLGMMIEIDPDPDPKPEEPSYPSELTLEIYSGGDDETTEVLDQSEVKREHCPKCGSGNMQLGICQDCGIVAAKYIAAKARHAEPDSVAKDVQSSDPYSPPEADLEEQEEGEMVGPRSVSIGRAFSWVAGGWRLFKSSPLAWVIALVVWFVVSVLIAIIPLAGPIIISLIAPTLIAGFMIGCHEDEEGGQFSVSHLFAGFSQNTGQSIMIGLFYLVFSGLIGVAMVLTMFGSLQDLIAQGADVAAVSSMVLSTPMLIGFGLAILAFFVLFMAYLFAPALVALDDLTAWQAMKLSFIGCLKNVLPLTLYSILALILFMLNGVFMVFIPVLPILSIILFALGILVLLPIQIGAIYSAYKDIYYD
jgi:hypothetical protein